MKSFSRRSFLRLGALAGAASSVSWSKRAMAAGEPLGVKRYVPLGNTGMEISDISFGASRLRQGEEHLVHHALDRGVNYFDTAESYTKSVSETVLGNALKGRRDKVYIATKHHAGADASRAGIMAALNASLARLQTDHVDVYMNHAVNDTERLKNREWFEFVEQAKKDGKIRFAGISGHAGHLSECMEYAVDAGMVDVVLAAHNFGQDPAFYEGLIKGWDMIAVQPDLPRVLQKARDKGIGVIAMKVLRGAKLNDMRPFEQGGATYAQAAFRWVLQSSFTDAAIISMTSRDDIDEYLGGSGGVQVSLEDKRLLEQYARLTSMTYCQHACNDCEGVCPHGVPISDVLRTRMYAVDYGDLEFAQDEYRQLGAGAKACLSCDGQPCQKGCSNGLQIAQLCGPTHQMLG